MYFGFAWSDELAEKYKDDYSEAEFYVWPRRKVKIFLYSKTGKKKDNVTKIVPINGGEYDYYDMAREYTVRMYTDSSKTYEIGKVVHELIYVCGELLRLVVVVHDGDGRYGVLFNIRTKRNVTCVRKGTYELKSEAVSFAHQIMKEISPHGYIEHDDDILACYNRDDEGKFIRTEFR